MTLTAYHITIIRRVLAVEAETRNGQQLDERL